MGNYQGNLLLDAGDPMLAIHYSTQNEFDMSVTGYGCIQVNDHLCMQVNVSKNGAWPSFPRANFEGSFVPVG